MSRFQAVCHFDVYFQVRILVMKIWQRLFCAFVISLKLHDCCGEKRLKLLQVSVIIETIPNISRL